MEIDPVAETAKLRTRSAWMTRRLFVITLLTVTFSCLFWGMYLYCIFDADNKSKRVKDLAFLGFCCLITGMVFFYVYWRRTKSLIRNGIVCFATVTHVTYLPKRFSFVYCQYYFGGSTHKKTFNFVTANAMAVAHFGQFPVVTLPDQPTIVEPLFVFAQSGKEADAILSGQGLRET